MMSGGLGKFNRTTYSVELVDFDHGGCLEASCLNHEEEERL